MGETGTDLVPADEHLPSVSSAESVQVLERVLAKTLLEVEKLLDQEHLESKELFKIGSLVGKIAPLVRPNPQHEPQVKKGDVPSVEAFMARIQADLSPSEVEMAITHLSNRVALGSRKPGRPARVIQPVECEVTEEGANVD